MIKLKQNFRFFALLFCIAFLPFGCAAGEVARKKTTLMEIQKPLMVEKTGHDNRPEWTSAQTFIEDKDGFHFSGGYMGGVDYALTLRLAKSEATKNVLESIEMRAQAEFGSAIHGQNRNDSDLGRYVTDAVAWTVDNLKINGIKQNKTYYEKIFDPVSQSFKYNAWVQLEISMADYVKAKTEAGKRLLDKAIQEQNEEAKEKAIELLEKLRQKT